MARYTNIIALTWASLWIISLLVLLVVAFLYRREERGSSPIRETIYILPFALFPIGANLLHLLLFSTKPVLATLQLTLFLGMWIYLWKSNMDDPKWCKTKILGFFAIQMGILFAVKHWLS